MKRSLTLFAIAVIAFSACANPSTQERIEAYQAAGETIINEYNEAVDAINSDPSLDQETKEARIFDEETEAEGKIVELGLNTIRKNPSDSVALVALSDIYYMADPEDLESVLEGLSDEIKQSELAQNVITSLRAKKNTVEGKMFTDFTVAQDPDDPEGSTVSFSDFIGKGKYVLVDFWASWCGPCKREIPNIAAVYEKYAGEDFDVLSVAVWDEIEDTKAAAIENGVVWSQIINAQKVPTDIYGIDGIPHIILFGPDGTILKRDLRGSGIEAAVAEALGR